MTKFQNVANMKEYSFALPFCALGIVHYYQQFFALQLFNQNQEVEELLKRSFLGTSESYVNISLFFVFFPSLFFPLLSFSSLSYTLSFNINLVYLF